MYAWLAAAMLVLGPYIILESTYSGTFEARFYVFISFCISVEVFASNDPATKEVELAVVIKPIT